MAKLTKNNYKKFTRRNLLPNLDGSKPNSEQAEELFSQNMRLIEQFKSYYDSLQSLRNNCERCCRYYFGDQLSDLVPDPEYSGKKITEEELIRRNGQVPLTMNVINKAGQAVVGVYTQTKLEPLAISRDRDEQKLGEMMSIALQYVYQNQNLNGVNIRSFENFLINGIVAFRVGYDIDQERKVSDVKVTMCDIYRMAWNNNTSGMYFKNISCIGYLHDMDIDTVLSQFAHSTQEARRIEQIYEECNKIKYTQQQFEEKTHQKHIDFYTTLNPTDCRVIEIWAQERFESLYCHDIAKGEEFFVDTDEEQNIIAENQRRQLEMLSAGGDINDAALIEYEYRNEKRWVVRYLSPSGYILHQEETPYWHGSHPFVIGAYPLINGEIHSFVSKAINVQRMINRLMMRIEFSRMNDQKGFQAVQKKVLERSKVSIDTIAAAYTSPNAMIALDWEAGEEVFKKPESSGVSQNDVQMYSNYMQLLDEITGAHGAMRGETPKAGTPSSLYAQQTENANNNVADLLNWYNGLIRERDYKIMFVIQQFYKDRRFLNIAGKDYSEQSKWYDPQKVRESKFDLALVDNQPTGLMRQQNEQLLLQLLQSQQIDLITYTEMSSTPFADKLLERIKARQQEQQDAAQEQQALAAMQGQQEQQLQQPQ